MSTRGSRAAFAMLAGLSVTIALASAGGCYIRPVTFTGVDGSDARIADGASTSDAPGRTDAAAPDATDGRARDVTDGTAHDAADGTSDTGGGPTSDAMDATDRLAIDGSATGATDATGGPVTDPTDGPASNPIDGPASDASDVPATTLFTLTIGLAGNGAGTVTAPGISCSNDCATDYSPGTLVTLSAIAADDSMFRRWSVAGCPGTDPCQVTMSAAATVTATFALKRFQLAVSLAGNGTGTVSSRPDGFGCGPACVAYDAHTMVTLTATAGSDSTFAGWSGGGCSGTGTCVVTTDALVSVTAAFALQQAVLTVGVAGTGAGTVTSRPIGISCPTSCSAVTDPGTVITLTATPADGSTFIGWSGACAGFGACQVTVTSATTVMATFTQPEGRLAVTNFDHSVEVFAPGADGDVAPVQLIAGLSTTLSETRDVAVFSDKIVVADLSVNAVDVFSLGANGDVAPTQRIAGASTNLSGPISIAVFGGEIYVGQAGSILVFPLEATGDVPPSRAITSIVSCNGLAISSGEIFAIDSASGIVVFPVGASGPATPIRTIAGPAAQLVVPLGIAVSGGEIFISDLVANQITVFPRTADGNVAPSRIIGGNETQLAGPTLISIALGELYVPNLDGNSIDVFPVNAAGNVAPTRRIVGASTQLSSPTGTTIF